MNWKSKEYWIVIALLVLTGFYVNVLRYSRVDVQELVDLNKIPTHFESWYEKDAYSIDQATQDVLKASQTFWRKYRNYDDKNISLFVAYFKDQKYGAQIHSPKHCLPGGGWKIIDKSDYDIVVHNSPEYRLRVNKMINSNGRHDELMLYWFWTRSGPLTSEYSLKIDLAKNALLRKPTDAAFVRINLPISENQSESLQYASQFISELFPSLNVVLPFDK